MNENVLAVLIPLGKFLYFSFVSSLFSIYLVLRFFRVGWSLFERKNHTLPASLTRDYNHKYIQLSKVKLHYVEEGDPSAPPLIFIHGFPEFWYSWRHQIKHFSDKYRVIAIDQRGYGQSERLKNIEDYKLDNLIGDVKELIEKLGYKKVTLVAHDWGAIVAWCVAAHFPELLDRLIIMNVPHPKAYEQAVAVNKWQLVKSWYIFFFQVPWLPEFFQQLEDQTNLEQFFVKNQKLADFGPEQLEAWKATFQGTEGWRGPINFYRAMTRYRDVQQFTKKTIIQPPTLIIWGENDLALTKESAEFTLQHCANAKIKFLPGITHWVQQHAPAQVNKAMEEFLSS